MHRFGQSYCCRVTVPLISKDKIFWAGPLNARGHRSDVKAGDLLKKGDIVGTVVDFSGEVLETIRAPATGIVLWKIDSPVALPGDTAVVVHSKGKSTLSAT